MTNVLSPLAMAVQAAACAAVGATNVLANQSRVVALNRASASAGGAGGRLVLT
jgi:hypothetical protein